MSDDNTKEKKCPNCGSNNAREVKGRINSWRCRKCDKQFSWPEPSYPVKMQENFSAKNVGAEITKMSNQRIHTLEQLIEVCEINTEEWEIDRWVCNKWEVGSRNKSGNIETSPLFQVKAWLKRKVNEIRARNTIEDIRKDALNYSPKYPKIQYPKYKDGMLYEIAIPDIHFGRLTWEEESGSNYDVKIATKAVNEVIDDLLQVTKVYNISKILLPIGNDFYNVNSKLETTVHGTPQQEDTRWQKTFRLGRQLAVQLIEKCSQVAPVDVLIIPGNHDEERSFYLGDALECWFHQSQDVSINNDARKRKYYTFGKNLIGFTHGYWEKIENLPLLMASEVPLLWGQSVIREWHLGDKHHKKDLLTRTNENIGVMVRILRSLTSEDAWTFDKGFIGNQKAAESFLWDPNKGVRAQFTSSPQKYE